MNNKRELFASIISDNPKNIFQNLKIYEEMGISGYHFDVMDGIFVPRFWLYPELMEAIRAESKLPIEVHLMVSNVAPYLKRFASAGATRIIIHLETLQQPKSIISQIHEMGIEVGIALNPKTHIDSLNKIISEVDLVLLMAINPGIPKHPFIPETLDKLVSLRRLIIQNNSTSRIGIDGGVTFQNVVTLFKNGADILICGSGTIFKSENTLESNLVSLTTLINESF